MTQQIYGIFNMHPRVLFPILIVIWFMTTGSKNWPKQAKWNSMFGISCPDQGCCWASANIVTHMWPQCMKQGWHYRCDILATQCNPQIPANHCLHSRTNPQQPGCLEHPLHWEWNTYPGHHAIRGCRNDSSGINNVNGVLSVRFESGSSSLLCKFSSGSQTHSLVHTVDRRLKADIVENYWNTPWWGTSSLARYLFTSGAILSFYGFGEMYW